MSRYLGDILVLSSVVSWGASYLLVKEAIWELPGFNLVGMRFTIALALTAAVFRAAARKIGTRELAYGFCLGALIFCSGGLLATGLKTTTIANAGFLVGAMVVFVSIFEAALARRFPPPRQAAGVGLAIVGVGVLTVGESIAIHRGDLYCLLASVALAVHVIVAGRAARSVNAIGASIVQFGSAGLLAWTASFLTENTTLPHSWRIGLAVIILGVFCTAAAFVCQVVGQKHVSSTRTAFYFTLEPVFAILFASTFAYETPTWRVYVGGAILLAGIYVSEYRRGATVKEPIAVNGE